MGYGLKSKAFISSPTFPKRRSSLPKDGNKYAALADIVEEEINVDGFKELPFLYYVPSTIRRTLGVPKQRTVDQRLAGMFKYIQWMLWDMQSAVDVAIATPEDPEREYLFWNFNSAMHVAVEQAKKDPKFLG